MKKTELALVVAGLLAFFAGGCAQAYRETPQMGFGQMNIYSHIERGDIVVMDRVEGTSDSVKILCGLVEVVDGNKVALLGIKFFKDKYVLQKGFLGLPESASVQNRAYYVALEKTPDADAVMQKAVVIEHSEFPLIYSKDTATYSGKAIKLKSDK